MSGWTAEAVDPTVQCESAVLGTVLRDNKAYWICTSAGLQPEHFASDLHASLWRNIGALLQLGQQASPATVLARLANDEALRSAGGPNFLAGLATASGGVRDLPSYAAAVRDWAVRRSLVRLSLDMERLAGDGERSVANLVQDFEARLVGCASIHTLPAMTGMALAGQQAQAEHERAQQHGALDGVPFGLKALDAVVGGAARSDLVVIAGRPGMGKSALAQHIALHNARAGRQVVLFSLEMSAEQIGSRAIAQECGISTDRLRRGDITPAELEATRRAVATLDLPLTIDDSGGLTPAQIEARLRNKAIRDGRIDLVLIDYIQLMRNTGHAENRVQELTAITGYLKAMAKRLDVPVIALSQLNRAVETRDGKWPQLSDLRDSGSIEQDADCVVFVYREEYYLLGEEPRGKSDEARQRWTDRLAAASGKADLIVAKNRHGACRSAVVGFDDRLTRFHDLA